MTENMNVKNVKYEEKVYPRTQWKTDTVNRYVDALESGDVFPPIIVEKESDLLLDGKHRLEAHKKAGRETIEVQKVDVPEGMTKKYFAATLSAKHGDRLSNADIKQIAIEEFEADPTLDATEWGKKLGVSKRTVYNHVSHIINREKRNRQSKAWHLAKLGWTQREIAEKLDVTERTIRDDTGKNCNLAKISDILGPGWNEQELTETAERLDLNLTDCYAAAIAEMSDAEKLKTLGIKTQPYDVWKFQSCHDLMGDNHPGRIPGELIAHVLYFFTEPGQLVIDPMAGSGTTLDACLLMDRKCRGYDIDTRHERIDIEEKNLSEGWPDKTQKADLVFWDPPYFDKMDSKNIGEEGYIENSISKLSPGEYLDWLFDKFQKLHNNTKKECQFAFLMSDWDPENAKRHADSSGIFLWDYADKLRKAGWKIRRQIQCPLPTQQVHPDTVNKFRKSKLLAILNRYLLVCVK